jgi:hypothetical protein
VELSIIVVIDPVKDLRLLDVLVHSLNLQTARSFEVVFFNQTLASREELLARLRVKPAFPYRFHSLPKERFLGKYPIWDLYAFHADLLERDLLREYFICLHMEEFFDPDYVEQLALVLDERPFDVLMGNLTRTPFDVAGIAPILETETAADLAATLERCGATRAPHWTFSEPLRLRPFDRRRLATDLAKRLHFGPRRRLRPTRRGYTRLPRKWEDLSVMRKDFALRHNWFLRGHSLCFEDIHICDQGGGRLSEELARITDHPVYFDRRRIYHLRHGKFYFQLEDREFTDRMLEYETDDPILQTLQRAILLHRRGTLTLRQALRYTRNNAEGTGTQNLNYRLHLRYLRSQA